MFYPLFQIKLIQNWAVYFPNLFDVSETTGNFRQHNISRVFMSVDFWAKKNYFHEYVEANRLLAGRSGVRFPTEGGGFLLS
jgi:hypothetical protein